MEKIERLSTPRLLTELVHERQERIFEIKSSIEKWVNDAPEQIKLAAEQAPLDDIFVLRFVLSNENEANSNIADKVRQTLEWRAEHLHLLKQIAEGSCDALKPLNEYLCRAYIGDFGGHCFFVERHGHNDLPNFQRFLNIYSSKSEISLPDAMLLHNEFAFRKVDTLGRRTNRLSKVVVLFFLDNVSLLPTPNIMKAVSAVGTSSKKSNILYPQLLGSGIVFSSQSVILRVVMRVATTFMSEKTMGKVVICPGYRKGASPSACPGLKKLDPTLDWSQALPTCANGKAKMPVLLRSRIKNEEDE